MYLKLSLSKQFKSIFYEPDYTIPVNLEKAYQLKKALLKIGIVLKNDDYAKLTQMPDCGYFITELAYHNSVGEVFFDKFFTGEDYNDEDMLNIVIQYFINYGLGETTDIFTRDIKADLDAVAKDIQLFSLKTISTDLNKLVATAFETDANPTITMKEILIFLASKGLINPEYYPDTCKNKELLKILITYTHPDFYKRFIQTISQLREVISIMLENKKRLSTSQKRFILSFIDEQISQNVIDDFRPNKIFGET